MAVPKTDARFAQYSQNFYTRGSAAPQEFGLSEADMEQYGLLHQAWSAAYAACMVEGGKSAALVRRKETAKAAILPFARQLYSFIQSSLSVSDANKLLMGVTIPKSNPTPTAPPDLAPLIAVLSVVGRSARFKLTDASAPTSRRRPINAAGAMIMIYAGPTPPGSDVGWKPYCQTGKPMFTVQFANDIAPGTPCWVIARWYSRRGEYSPASSPAQVYLQAGPAIAAA